jgi:hypothetical protein
MGAIPFLSRFPEKLGFEFREKLGFEFFLKQCERAPSHLRRVPLSILVEFTAID